MNTAVKKVKARGWVARHVPSRQGGGGGKARPYSCYCLQLVTVLVVGSFFTLLAPSYVHDSCYCLNSHPQPRSSRQHPHGSCLPLPCSCNCLPPTHSYLFIYFRRLKWSRMLSGVSYKLASFFGDLLIFRKVGSCCCK